MIKYKVRTGAFDRILVWWGICYMGIYELITKDNKWIENYKWSKEQFEEFENDLSKVIKNLYQYTLEESKIVAQNIMIKYSLNVY